MEKLKPDTIRKMANDLGLTKSSAQPVNFSQKSLLIREGLNKAQKQPVVARKNFYEMKVITHKSHMNRAKWDPKKALVTGTSSWTWKSFKNSLLYGSSPGASASSKIAVFDMDETLISGKRATSVLDWEFTDVSVPSRLREISGLGYRIVVVSNQMGVSLGRVSPDELKVKIENVFAEIQVPVSVLFATKKDKFRKPSIGMWEFIENILNCTKTIDKSKCVSF